MQELHRRPVNVLQLHLGDLLHCLRAVLRSEAQRFRHGHCLYQMQSAHAWLLYLQQPEPMHKVPVWKDSERGVFNGGRLHGRRSQSSQLAMRFLRYGIVLCDADQ